MGFRKLLMTGVAAGSIVAAQPFAVSAGSAFTCTPSAIHAKSQFVVSTWNWLNNSSSDNATGDQFRGKIDRIWDGNGDCSGDEDMSKFSATTQMELLKIHFYGDMMTVAFAIGAKEYTRARQHMDDWFEADKLIQSNKAGMESAVLADDARYRDQMAGYSSKLAKLGYKSTFKN